MPSPAPSSASQPRSPNSTTVRRSMKRTNRRYAPATKPAVSTAVTSAAPWLSFACSPMPIAIPAASATIVMTAPTISSVSGKWRNVQNPRCGGELGRIGCIGGSPG